MKELIPGGDGKTYLYNREREDELKLKITAALRLELVGEDREN